MAAGDGLVSITPTSLIYSGTGTGTINSDGGIEFTECNSLYILGVFSSEFKNYLITGWIESISAGVGLAVQLSDNNFASAGGYVYQYLTSLITPGQPTVTAGRTSGGQATIHDLSYTRPTGSQLHLYNPAVAGPTAGRSVDVGGARPTAQDVSLFDCAWTHYLTSSYNSIRYFPNSDYMTGALHVFGYED